MIRVLRLNSFDLFAQKIIKMCDGTDVLYLLTFSEKQVGWKWTIIYLNLKKKKIGSMVYDFLEKSWKK